jgi:hypothetical protein
MGNGKAASIPICSVEVSSEDGGYKVVIDGKYHFVDSKTMRCRCRTGCPAPKLVTAFIEATGAIPQSKVGLDKQSCLAEFTAWAERLQEKQRASEAHIYPFTAWYIGELRERNRKDNEAFSVGYRNVEDNCYG